MKYTNLIDSCQVQYGLNIKLIRQKWTGVVIDSEPHPSHMSDQNVNMILLWIPNCFNF